MKGLTKTNKATGQTGGFVTRILEFEDDSGGRTCSHAFIQWEHIKEGDGQELARIRFKGFRTPPDYGYYYIMSFSFCKRYITKYSPKFSRTFLLYCTTFVHFPGSSAVRVRPAIAPHAENRHTKRQSLGNRCGKPYARHAKQRRHEDNTARQEA